MKRRLAREIVVQSLYQMEMNEDATVESSVTMILDEVNGENEIEANPADVSPIEEYVRAMLLEITEKKTAIDDILQGYLTGWQVDRLSKVDRQILRLACFELVYKEDVPPKAVINEAIELAKHFGTEESGKFVNGVLGRLLKELDELKPKA